MRPRAIVFAGWRSARSRRPGADSSGSATAKAIRPHISSPLGAKRSVGSCIVKRPRKSCCAWCAMRTSSPARRTCAWRAAWRSTAWPTGACCGKGRSRTCGSSRPRATPAARSGPPVRVVDRDVWNEIKPLAKPLGIAGVLRVCGQRRDWRSDSRSGTATPLIRHHRRSSGEYRPRLYLKFSFKEKYTGIIHFYV